MISFTPGDVWRRETKADSELLILRSQPAAGEWRCVLVSIGKVSGYAATIETTVTEDAMVGAWRPLIPDPDFVLKSLARGARRVMERFEEMCDPRMTPRRAEYETRPAGQRKQVLILARTYQIAKDIAQERGLASTEWQAVTTRNAARGYGPETWDLVVHESAWELPATRGIIAHLRAQGFAVPGEDPNALGGLVPEAGDDG